MLTQLSLEMTLWGGHQLDFQHLSLDASEHLIKAVSKRFFVQERTEFSKNLNAQVQSSLYDSYNCGFHWRKILLYMQAHGIFMMEFDLKIQILSISSE